MSGARNTGIPLAKGKYIQFIDSDDYLEPNVLGSLLEQMERDDLDVLRYNYQNVNEQYEIFVPCKNPKQFVSYSEEVCDGRTFRGTIRICLLCLAICAKSHTTAGQKRLFHTWYIV